MSDFEHRARLAGARLQATVGAVQPRSSTTVSKRLPAAVGAAVAIAVIAGVAAAVSIGTSANRPTTLNPTRRLATPGGKTQVFAPAGLGASVSLPASWKAVPTGNGFQFAMRAPGSAFDFLLAGQRTGVLAETASQVEQDRAQSLHQVGATITSAAIGVVDHHPAVRFGYRLPSPAGTVTDTEFDITASTTTLPVGANQQQTIYSQISIVLGGPASNPDQALLNWIASTIKLTG